MATRHHSMISATRAQKNLRWLRANAPDVFQGEEPPLGWESALPVDLLNRLDTAPPASFGGPLDPGRLARVSFPAVTRAVTEPLFSGTVYFVQVSFDTRSPAAPVSVPSADLRTAVSYAATAAPALTAYASQYGQTAMTISPSVLTYPVTVSGPTYSDADVQTWVNGIKSGQALPDSACVAILNPQGLTNSSADLGQGVIGYHGMATVPYVFVNVLGTGLTLDDAAGYYAAGLSHELAEMDVDPRADSVNPEVCDPCAGNCNNQYYSFFDSAGSYLGSGQNLPPGFAYHFFTSAVVKPASATDCPAPAAACAYGPFSG